MPICLQVSTQTEEGKVTHQLPLSFCNYWGFVTMGSFDYRGKHGEQACHLVLLLWNISERPLDQFSNKIYDVSKLQRKPGYQGNSGRSPPPLMPV